MNKFINKIKRNHPLVLALTNNVSNIDVAQAINNIGGTCIMSESKEDSLDLLKMANSLYLNIGTINKNQLEIMISCAIEANKQNIPIIIDPVGVGASTERKNAFRKLSKYKISLIRCNQSEALSILEFDNKSHGVDSRDQLKKKDVINLAKKISSTYKCFVVITGKEDVICDNSHNIKIVKCNAGKIISKIVGSGCVLTGILAAGYSVSPNLNFIYEIIKFYKECSYKLNIKNFKSSFYSRLINE